MSFPSFNSNDTKYGPAKLSAKANVINLPKLAKASVTASIAGVVMFGLAGCHTPNHFGMAATTSPTNGAFESTQAQSLASIKEVFDATSADVPTLTAVGYAVVSSQPGKSDAQKRLMAIRSARMAAMRDLAEQIHGLQVDSSTTVIDLMVQNDTFRGVVSGTIRGARTVRINPTGSDTYEIVLEIDRDMISHLMNKARTQVG
jgi:hypothetical protein